MNKTYIKIGVITSIVLIGGFLAYKLSRRGMNRMALEFNNSEVDSPTSVSNPKLETEAFNSDKKVGMGSLGINSKTVQETLNNIISDAYKYGKSVDSNWASGVNTDAKKESYRSMVANIPKLKIDGMFGKKSTDALIKIVGVKSASYNEVKGKRMSFAKEYGVLNPYK